MGRTEMTTSIAWCGNMRWCSPFPRAVDQLWQPLLVRLILRCEKAMDTLLIPPHTSYVCSGERAAEGSPRLGCH